MAPRSRNRALVGLSDQLLYSLTNFVLTISVARYSSVDQFGSFSVLVATFLIASSVCRGLASEPHIIRYSSAPADTWRRAAASGVVLAVGYGFVLGVALAATTWLVLPGAYQPLGYYFAAAMPVLMAQDFLRYAALAAARPGRALANDLTVAIVQAVLTVAAISTGHDSPEVFLSVWAVSGAMGLLTGSVLLKLQLRLASLRVLLHDAGLAIRLAGDNLATQLVQQGTAYAVVATSGLAAAAGLRAAQTVCSPAAILTLGVYSAMTPELVRLRSQSLVAVKRVLRIMASGLTIANIVVLAAAVACPASIGTELFGPSWSRAHPLLIFIAIGVVGGGLANTAVAGLRSFSDARRTLQSRAASVVVTLALLIPFSIVDGARGASISIAISGVLQAAIWWRAFNLSYRSRQDGDAVSIAQASADGVDESERQRRPMPYPRTTFRAETVGGAVPVQVDTALYVDRD